jgi:hypothetical protein
MCYKLLVSVGVVARPGKRASQPKTCNTPLVLYYSFSHRTGALILMRFSASIAEVLIKEAHGISLL